MSLRDALVIGMGAVAIGWYYVCLYAIGSHPPDATTAQDTFRGFMSLSLTTIGASLATFVGMLLGIRSVAESVKPEASAQNPATPQIQRLAGGGLTSTLQWVAAGLYVLSLLIAIWYWYQFRAKADPAITNLGTTLLGLVGGALSIMLNLPQRSS